MDPWVRYSVTVYLGLLLAGTLIGSETQPGPQRGPIGRLHAEPWPEHLTRVTPPSSTVTTVPAPARAAAAKTAS